MRYFNGLGGRNWNKLGDPLYSDFLKLTFVAN